MCAGSHEPRDERAQRKLELESVIAGRTLTIFERGALASDSDRYAIRLGGDKNRPLEITEVFGVHAMQQLVEFIGYPRESTERADRLRNEVNMLREDLARADARLDREAHEIDEMRRVAATLVNHLKDAWWLEAANAYRALKDWVEG